LSSEAQEGLLKLKSIFKTENVRAWYLHPGFFQLAGERLEWKTEMGSRVVQPLLSMVQIRRTMRTACQVPDGPPTYPCDGLKPSTVVVQEVAFKRGSTVGRRMSEWNSNLSKKLYTPEVPAPVPDAQVFENTVQPDVSSDAKLNFGIHRQLTIMAHDPRNFYIFTEARPTLFGTLEAHTKFLKEQTTSSKSQTASAMKRAKALNAKGENCPVVGTEHIKELTKNDTTGGLSYAYYKTRGDPDMPAPGSRGGWAA
jgi:hypothetical protein